MVWGNALYLNLKILLVTVMMVYRVVYNAKVVSLSTKPSNKISQSFSISNSVFFLLLSSPYLYKVHKEKLNRNLLVATVYSMFLNPRARVALLVHGAVPMNIQPCSKLFHPLLKTATIAKLAITLI